MTNDDACPQTTKEQWKKKLDLDFFPFFVFCTLHAPFSPLHPQHLLQPLQLQLPVGQRVLDRLRRSRRSALLFLSSFLTSSSLASTAAVCPRPLELGPNRRHELRPRGTATTRGSVRTPRSPRRDPQKGAVQVQGLGPQQEMLEVEGWGSRSRRARRHYRDLIDRVLTSFFRTLLLFLSPFRDLRFRRSRAIRDHGGAVDRPDSNKNSVQICGGKGIEAPPSKVFSFEIFRSEEKNSLFFFLSKNLLSSSLLALSLSNKRHAPLARRGAAEERSWQQ